MQCGQLPPHTVLEKDLENWPSSIHHIGEIDLLDKIPQQLKWGWLKRCNSCVFKPFSSCFSQLRPEEIAAAVGSGQKNSPFREAKGPKEMDMDLPLTKCFKLTTLFFWGYSCGLNFYQLSILHLLPYSAFWNFKSNLGSAIWPHVPRHVELHVGRCPLRSSILIWPLQLSWKR